MRTRAPVAAASAALALVVAAPASAYEERQIAPGRHFELQAGGGFVSWWHSDRQVFWHDGDESRSAGPLVRPLGTDAEGRAVGLLVHCGGTRCVIRDRRLPDGRVVTRFATASNGYRVDEHRGSFLVGFRGKGHARGIYLRRRGDDTLRRLTKMRPGNLSISTRAMTNSDFYGSLYAASRERPHRWRLITTSDDPELNRGADEVRFVTDTQAEGRYAYWLETRIHNYDNGKPSDVATRVLRVDPGPTHRHVEFFQPPREVGSLAVTGGNLYYTDRGTGAVYEVRHPYFYRTGDPVPVPAR